MNSIVYLEKNDIHCTLCTYLYCHFAMMYGAEKIGYDAYIHCPKGLFLQSYDDDVKYREEPNGYNWYFKQPKVDNPPSRNKSPVWLWEAPNWGTTMGGSSHQLMGQPLSVIRDYYQKHLHFNEETNRIGQLIVDKYGIDFEKTIGICWRGCDIYLESLNGNEGRKYTPIEFYYEWIDKALEQIPDARIACTAEEEEILNPLFKRYGDRAFLIEEFYQAPRGSKHNPERFSPMSGYLRGLQPALMVWLFCKTAWLIKNRASTSAVASWLSKGEIININHTEVLGFPPHIEGVEYKGQLYQTTL